MSRYLVDWIFAAGQSRFGSISGLYLKTGGFLVPAAGMLMIFDTVVVQLDYFGYHRGIIVEYRIESLVNYVNIT